MFSKINKAYESMIQKLRENIPLMIVTIFIVIILVIYLWHKIVISVHSGQGGVLYRRLWGGTVVDKIYGEGLHIILPFNKMYIYDCRVQQVSHHFSVLTNNGLTVNIVISIRYYPEYDLLGILHQKLGPDYVNTVVIPEIESVFRKIVGKRDAEGLYTTDKSFIETSLNQAIDRLARKFIIVDDVIIKRITLPESVDKTIQYKLEQKHRADTYKYILQKEQKEIERKKLEATGLKEFSKALNEKVLHWMSINATLELSKSENSKIIVIGSGKSGLPIIGSIPFTDENEILEDILDNSMTSLTKTTQQPIINENNE
jgi:regulator of protease activity HflC (stomatin/prohibitin superfamily)